MPDERGLVADDLGVSREVATPEREEEQDDQDEQDDPAHAHERVGDDPQHGLVQRQRGDAAAGHVVR